MKTHKETCIYYIHQLMKYHYYMQLPSNTGEHDIYSCQGSSVHEIIKEIPAEDYLFMLEILTS